MSRAVAVFFDVDFTLIHPGPRFQAVGYGETCARHGVAVAVDRFDTAVAGAGALLDSSDQLYDAQVFINYTRRIIELMGGAGGGVDAAARELYHEWAGNHHFSLYDDVECTLRRLRDEDIRVGLISNGHRRLDAFQAHFALDGLIAASVSSCDHGYMKPHPSIFLAALALMRVAPADAVMVGDSLVHDVMGARHVGMRAVLLARGQRTTTVVPGESVIRTLTDLPPLL